MARGPRTQRPVDDGGLIDSTEHGLDGNVLTLPLGAESADEQDLDGMLAELRAEGGRTYEVKIYRTPNGNRAPQEFLFAYAPGDLTMTQLQIKLQAEYGPGQYRGRVYERGTDDEGTPYAQIVKGGNFSIAIGARTINAPTSAGNADVNELVKTLLAERSKPQPIGGIDPMIALMMEQQRASTEMMFKMFGLFLPIMMNTKQDPIEQLAKMMTLTDRLRGEGGNGEGGNDTVLGQVLDAVKEIGPPLINAVSGARAGRPAIPPTAGAAPRIAPDAVDPTLRSQLMEYAPQLTQLPLAIKMGASPEKIAETIVDSIEDEIQLNALTAAIKHPQIVIGIAAIVPALIPHEAWVKRLVIAINAEIEATEFETEDPTPGEGEGDGDADHGNASSPA